MSELRIRVDDRTWDSATEARRNEWKALMHAVGGVGRTMEPSVAELHIGVSEQATQVVARDDAGDAIFEATIARDVLADLFTEYVDIVRQMARDDSHYGTTRLETLDMAKRVTHDQGGRTLQRHCRALEMDLPTARRLFSLLLSLRVDTTRLTGIHGHRSVR